MGDDDLVTYAMLRDAVSNEVRQQMTPYRLQADQDHGNVQLMMWTLFGNSTTGQVGIVQAMKDIRTSLEALVKSGEQRQWLQKGIAIGIAINLAQQFGIFDILAHLARGTP